MLSGCLHVTCSYHFSCTFSVFTLLWRIHPRSAALPYPSESRVLSQVSLLSSSTSQSASIPDALCDKDRDCPAGEAVVAGNGKGRVSPPVLFAVEVGSFRGISLLTAPEIPDDRERQGLSFLYYLLLRLLPCVRLCGGWAKAPRAAQRSNKRAVVPAERPLPSREEDFGWQ